MFDGSRYVLNTVNEIHYTLRIMYFTRTNHYRTILNLNAASGSRYYCIPCNKKYSNDRYHRCSSRCYKCFQIPSYDQLIAGFQQFVICDLCQRYFLVDGCFEKHRAPGSYKNITSVCLGVRHCASCLKMIKIVDTVKHKCNEIFCNTCLKRVNVNHLCYMQPLSQRDNELKVIFTF